MVIYDVERLVNLKIKKGGLFFICWSIKCNSATKKDRLALPIYAVL